MRADASDNGRREKVNKRVSRNVNIGVRFYVILVSERGIIEGGVFMHLRNWVRFWK